MVSERSIFTLVDFKRKAVAFSVYKGIERLRSLNYIFLVVTDEFTLQAVITSLGLVC